VCAQVTLTKTGLSAIRTFGPLGVNNCINALHKDEALHCRKHNQCSSSFVKNPLFVQS
jgi:hypothetical protein